MQDLENFYWYLERFYWFRETLLLTITSTLALICFLPGWLILKRWMNRSGLEESGFSPVATASLFAHPLYAVGLIILLMWWGIANYPLEQISLFHDLLKLAVAFAPAFFLPLPFAVASVVIAKKKKPISRRILWLVFAVGIVVSWFWFAIAVGNVE